MCSLNVLHFSQRQFFGINRTVIYALCLLYLPATLYISVLILNVNCKDIRGSQTLYCSIYLFHIIVLCNG